MWRAAAVVGCTNSLDKAPPKCPGSSFQGTSAILRMSQVSSRRVCMLSPLYVVTGARSVVLVARADGRLALPQPRQFPDTGAARIHVRADLGVDEIGPA